MGNKTFSSSSEAVVQRAEQRVGKLPASGRYHRSPRQLQDDYDVGDKMLGEGCSGKVFLALCRQTGAKFAVKTLHVRNISADSRQLIENEVELFLSMDHPRVARLNAVYECDGDLRLVMECMEGGE
eukprot:CAMPEP_0180527282 /NCGR_PEP_ID=MMETSP1036_2-20121128/60154_1 /TAXON_ID=632150 /ORGANISM="Azadinium spinosum, Strain 3D9" /LENGTH=125 /DNA_ID=CAMNT_0022540709 /DNA_START=84 /DNA_END=458 /DNA_ORIENTATION=-